MKDAKGHGSDPKGAHAQGVDQIGQSPARPAWWNKPTGNAFAKGMTEGQLTMEWLKNHNVPQTPDGKYMFYHAIPTGGARDKSGVLRAGALLETDQKAARYFAARDRSIDPDKNVTVHKLALEAHDIKPGVWASLRGDRKI